MAASLHANFSQFGPMQRKIDRLIDLCGDELREGIGAVLESGARRRVSETKVDPEGIPWTEWSDRYGARRPPGKSLLLDTGGLLDSIQYEHTRDTVTVFAAVEHAGVHQDGFNGVVNIAAHQRRITEAFGRELPFPVIVNVSEHQAKRNIPARPFVGMSPEEVQDIQYFVDGLADEVFG